MRRRQECWSCLTLLKNGVLFNVGKEEFENHPFKVGSEAIVSGGPQWCVQCSPEGCEDPLMNCLSITGGKACEVTLYDGVRHVWHVLQDGWVGLLSHH